MRLNVLPHSIYASNESHTTYVRLKMTRMYIAGNLDHLVGLKVEDVADGHTVEER